jgi:hypothetical protein
MGKYLKLGWAALAGLWAAGALAAANPYVGTWKKNVTESFGMSDPTGQETTVIRRHDMVLDYTWTGTGSDGKTETFSYSGKVDGKEQMLPGDTWLRGAMIATPSGVIEGKLWGPDGSLEDKFCILSAPRRMTCFATFTDGKGKVSLFKEVFDKE